MRKVLWRLIWGAAFLVFATRFRVSGFIPQKPVVFAPNHNSHADTAALQLALARIGHCTVLTAGAEDYFFRNPISSAFSRLIGVFPFPRSGFDGIGRARGLLESGSSVVVYPQGSRTGGPFRPGIGHLVGDDFEVVPVTIEGTREMLPKGKWIPRRTPVSIRFHPPMRKRPDETEREFASRVEDTVFGHRGFTRNEKVPSDQRIERRKVS